MDRDPFAPQRYVKEAEPLLVAALALWGGTVAEPRAREVTYRPGRSITVAYDAMVGWNEEEPRRDRLVVRAAKRPLPDVAPVAEDDQGNPVHVFPASRDPMLPGMARALDTGLVTQLFAELGIGESGDEVTLGLRSHRPLRRAVIEANGPSGRLFLKVVPPANVEDLHRRHRLLEGVVPVPNSLGWTPDGIVVLPTVPGQTLRQAIAEGSDVPRLEEIVNLLDRLPPELTELPGARPAADTMGEHVRLLSAVLPPAAARLQALSGGISEILEHEDDPGPVVPTHGDLYESQLLVQSGRISGLLDVDGAGAGRRVDDLANLIGHLSVVSRARGWETAERLGAQWIDLLDTRPDIDPAALRARVAAVVLGLATGSFRVQEEQWPRHTYTRLNLAEAWLGSARRAAHQTAG